MSQLGELASSEGWLRDVALASFRINFGQKVISYIYVQLGSFIYPTLGLRMVIVIYS